MNAVRRVCPGLLLILTFQSGAAQCWLNGALTINFGAAGGTSPVSSWSRLDGACYGPWTVDSATWHVRFCHFISPAPSSGIAPRTMTRWDGSAMQYDLYSDPAMTLLLGGVENSYPLSTWTQDISNNTTEPFTLTVYGKVPPLQPGLPAGVYQSHFSGGLLRWRWSRGNTPAPSAAECRAGTGGEGGGDINYFLNMSATLQDTCQIHSVTDLDFGEHTHNISTPLSSSSVLTLQCPSGTTWSLALDNGMSAQDGIRYMTNEQGDKVAYSLCRDAACTLPWGNKPGADTLTGIGHGAPATVQIYGRVPAQTASSPGHYRDTVIVTLTY
ncbi:Csu type fimbrial protein [Citrobacter koseri]|uniref:Csu type fimbrial protein n=1 Tax=Citrobacter koseri TaxID=545 RepID=UPI003899A1B2